jgi:hypothetical protein
VKGWVLSLFTAGVLVSVLAPVFVQAPATALAAPSQPAGMVARLDNAQLVERSDAVVYGRVTAVRSAGAVSEATVAVECALKGAPGKQVTVTFSRGQSESAVFEPKQVVLLFLTEASPGRYQTTAGVQGRFSFD